MDTLFRLLSVIFITGMLITPIQAEGDVEPPCPIEGFDTCVFKKGITFSLAVGDRDQQDFFYRAYQKACDDLDADGCFALGSLLSEADGIVHALPPHYLLPERTDKIAATEALEKSCSLGSAMGCAALSEVLRTHLSVEFENSNIADQARIISAQKSACDLDWLQACDVYLDLSRFIEPEDWPGGALNFSEAEKEVAARLCANNSLEGCLSEAIADFLIAEAMGGSELKFNEGMARLKDTCHAGHNESCLLHSKLSEDQED